MLTDGRHVMLPNGELHVLSVRQGDENHLYRCRVLVRPNGQTMSSSSAGRIILLPGNCLYLKKGFPMKQKVLINVY